MSFWKLFSSNEQSLSDAIKELEKYRQLTVDFALAAYNFLELDRTLDFTWVWELEVHERDAWTSARICKAVLRTVFNKAINQIPGRWFLRRNLEH